MLLEKETMIFQPGGLRTEVEGARQVAENYISDITNGIKVHPENDTTTGWVISDVLEYIKSGISHIRLWIENGAAKLRLGEADKAHLELDYHSMQLKDADGKTYFHVSDLRDISGNFDYKTTQKFKPQGELPTFDLLRLGTTSFTDWSVTLEDGTDDTSHWALDSSYVIIDGRLVEEVGSVSRFTNYATETVATLTGTGRSIEEARAYTLGTRTDDSYIGYMSVAEGADVEASGNYTHAQNLGTIARYDSQTAIGRFNVNSINNAFEIGGGFADDSRNTIFSVDWSGNVTVNGTQVHSDLKDKELIEGFDWKIDEFVNKLRPIAYRWRDSEDDSVHMGFGAQDVYQLSKDLGDMGLCQAVYRSGDICRDKDAADDQDLKWSLNYAELIPPLLLEIQRLMERVSNLERKVEELETKGVINNVKNN